MAQYGTFTVKEESGCYSNPISWLAVEESCVNMNENDDTVINFTAV